MLGITNLHGEASNSSPNTHVIQCIRFSSATNLLFSSRVSRKVQQNQHVNMPEQVSSGADEAVWKYARKTVQNTKRTASG